MGAFVPSCSIMAYVKNMFLILVTVLSLYINTTTGKLLCYSCISQGVDDTCITNPEKAGSKPIVECKYRYCTVRRYELPDQAGAISSFYRGCEDDPLPDGENPSDEIDVWAQSCTWDLCNTGDGLHKITPGGGGDHDDDTVIVVPGTGSANSIRTQFTVAPFLLVLAIFILTA